MSGKINIRSPYYLDAVEPTPPSVALTCELIKLSGFGVDQFGNVDLPTTEYGQILSYTSTDSDFSDGKFDTVLTDTSRTVTFRISIPFNFTNAASDYIDCDVSATQPEFVCTGGVTTNGTIPNQSLNTGGNTSTVDLSLYFTQGVLPIFGYRVTNSFPSYFSATTDGNILYITSLDKAGTHTFYIEAFDNDVSTCNATQSIQVTITATKTYDCTDSYLQGGLINQDGSIVLPNVNGNITSTKLTSGGSPITSVPANNTGGFISYTLYFDITVPIGYANTGATVECFKSYSQVSSELPIFNCEVASLTGQAIYTSGAVLKGNAAKGTIDSFDPIDFETVTSTTPRIVTFSITPPSSGYSNSGGDSISCPVELLQPSIEISNELGTEGYYVIGSAYVNPWEYMRISDNPTPINFTDSVEGEITYYKQAYSSRLGTRSQRYLVSEEPLEWLGTYIYVSSNNTRKYKLGADQYVLITRRKGSNLFWKDAVADYYVRLTSTGLISEVWKYDYINETILRIA